MNSPHPSRRSMRSSVEQQIHQSDRIDLLDQANALIANKLFAKYRDQDSFKPEVELSMQESDTYNAALRLLEREFDRGPTPLIVHQSKSEREDSIEWPDGSVTKQTSDKESSNG